MKSDYEKFIELYASFGILPVVKNKESEVEVILQEGTNPKLVGYNSFFSHILFDSKTGKFIEQGFWE